MTDPGESESGTLLFEKVKEIGLMPWSENNISLEFMIYIVFTPGHWQNIIDFKQFNKNF